MIQQLVPPTLTHGETIVLSSRPARPKRLAHRHSIWISKAADLREQVEQADHDVLWISFEKRLTDTLLRCVRWPSKKSLGSVILLHPPSLSSLSALQQCFRKVAFADRGGFLDRDELFEVLGSPRRDELLIGGFVDEASRTMTLWRGNLDRVTVPFSDFRKSGKGTAPNFSKFAVTDSGQTVRLGDYEASTESILYEHDPDYRKQVKARLIDQDPTIGGAIKRLRKQRKLSRADFSPLAEKTIARIERGEITQPKKRTLETIAARLGVCPNDLPSY